MFFIDDRPQWERTLWVPEAVGRMVARAIANNDRATLERSLKYHVNVNSRLGTGGATMLHVAAMASDPAMVGFLLDRGAPLEARDRAGRTPLHCAVLWAPTLSTMMALMLGGANVEALTDCQESPMQIANYSNAGHAKIQLLIDHGASLQDAGRCIIARRTLYFAALFGAEESFLTVTRACGEAWVAYAGIDVLITAAKEGKCGIITHAISAGVEVDCRTEIHGSTPLMLAADNGHSEAVRCLLDAGADPALCDWEGATAWRHAMLSGKFEVLRLLHLRGAAVK